MLLLWHPARGSGRLAGAPEACPAPCLRGRKAGHGVQGDTLLKHGPVGLGRQLDDGMQGDLERRDVRQGLVHEVAVQGPGQARAGGRVGKGGRKQGRPRNCPGARAGGGRALPPLFFFLFLPRSCFAPETWSPPPLSLLLPAPPCPPPSSSPQHGLVPNDADALALPLHFDDAGLEALDHVQVGLAARVAVPESQPMDRFIMEGGAGGGSSRRGQQQEGGAAGEESGALTSACPSCAHRTPRASPWRSRHRSGRRRRPR